MLIVHMLHCTDVGITAMPHYSGVITGTCGWSADASHLTAPRVPVMVIPSPGELGQGNRSRPATVVGPAHSTSGLVRRTSAPVLRRRDRTHHQPPQPGR